MKLKYAPLSDNASLFARDIVVAARELDSVELDYSLGSLSFVDEILQSFRQQGLDPSQVGATVVGFGCYLGEVIGRSINGCWVDFTPEEREVFGHAFGIRSPSAKLWNPLGRAFSV